MFPCFISTIISQFFWRDADPDIDPDFSGTPQKVLYDQEAPFLDLDHFFLLTSRPHRKLSVLKDGGL
jgi:hypothetical protein